MRHANNPEDRHALSVDVCWRLTAVFDSGSLHHVELLPEEMERQCLIFHAAGGREGGWRGTTVKFINSSDLPVKAASVFFKQTAYKQTQSCANGSK